MFSATATMEKMTAEVLVNISSFLSLSSILELSLTCKSFRHLIQDEHLFRRLTERDFGVEKPKDTSSWLTTYKHMNSQVSEQPTTTTTTTTVEEDSVKETLSEPVKETLTETIVNDQDDIVMETANEITTDPVTITSSDGCPHLTTLTDIMCEIKRVLYKSENKSLCDICLTNDATFLNMSADNHNEACTSCLNKPVEDENHYPIQLELNTGDLYCFKCEAGNPHKLTEERDGNTVKDILEIIQAPESEEDVDKRRKAEQFLYIQELRREDMTLMHYLVEKQWGRNWMLFRTREGSPLPPKISNNKLARLNGTLDPNIRLPMDKYRPSPETHGDIISEKLWSYLSKAYGVVGKAYNEDDIFAPEYARLRVYVDDYKKSIHLYP